MRTKLGAVGGVVAIAAALTIPACVSRETQERLSQASAATKEAKAAEASARAEVDRLLGQLKTATGPEVVSLEAAKADAVARLEAARAKKVEAAKALDAARAVAEAERLRNGVQIAEWAHAGLGGILGTIFPAVAPIIALVGSVIQSAKEKSIA